MQIFPTITSARPRLACELTANAVVAARTGDGTAASDATGLLSAIARVALPEGGLAPGLRVGNIVRFEAVAESVREALDAVSGRGAAARPTRAAAIRNANGNGANGSNRGQSVTLVVPDAAVRVLLLEFDSLPSKVEEALPVVRFRLKKLLPFDADDAAISYEVMSSGRSLVRVLAVAMPRLVLAEYESVVRAAGYEPGAVMPSTLAALAGMGESEDSVLVVNAGPGSVTTAIARGGVLLLHRSLDLQPMETVAAGLDALEERLELRIAEEGLLASAGHRPTGAFGNGVAGADGPALPYAPHGEAGFEVVDVEASASEWAAQEGNVYGMPYGEAEPGYSSAAYSSSTEDASGMISASTNASGRMDAGGSSMYEESAAGAALAVLAEDVEADEIARAVSVAAAYYEDTLGAAPAVILAAGPLGADELGALLERGGFVGDVEVREIVGADALEANAATAKAARGELAGVRGALRS
jgi:type IV pilus assembly protein PilM